MAFVDKVAGISARRSGYRAMAEPPPAEALEPKKDAQEILFSTTMMYRWPSVGWCFRRQNRRHHQGGQQGQAAHDGWQGNQFLCPL